MEYPDIFFFPLSEPEPITVLGLEKGVLARRIPDFLCLCLNATGQDRVGLLEMRAADKNGIPTGEWANFEELPDPEEVLSFLPEEGFEAAIIGTLQEKPHELEVELTVIRRAAGIDIKHLQWRLNLRDPARSCVELARQLAGELSLPLNGVAWDRHGTKDPRAFMHFLRGLDGAASLDPQVLNTRDPKALLLPLVEALEEDPDFGLALRRLHATITEGVAGFTMTTEDAFEILDRTCAAHPTDKEATAIIGEYLAALGDLERAEKWLRLAADHENPPAFALEALGIILANRGETVQARNLWTSGLELDGHPDFFAHLARLAFTEQNYDEAWDKVIRGLRRLSERKLHPGEWEGEEGSGGVLLRYLTEHLSDSNKSPPADVTELLTDLTGQISEPEDRLDLGICLALVGCKERAIRALRAALPHVENHDRRDLGCQYLGEILFDDFDDRLATAAKVTEAEQPAVDALEKLQEILDEVPQFWPAWFYMGRLHELRKEWEKAYDANRHAVALRRDQAEIHAKCGVFAHQLGRTEEAIESMEKAIELAPEEAGLHADLALLLFRAGRVDDAWRTLEVAETFDTDHEVVKIVRSILENGQPT